ncbi:MAG: mRNA surveillance protein pelota [Candidatus Micrarchaeota archaeon]|nr:mRNA surveillance protein pelota [Candidatus Micrarchaeota archaeon]
MKIIRFYEDVGVMKVRVDTLDDLWSVQRIIFPNDIVKSESERKFKPSEGDEGELKKVVITLEVEKTELDKDATRLRIMGKILDGRPIEFVKLKSYHTLNIAPGDILEIQKSVWKDYIVGVVKNAVSDSKKPRLGLIVADDEKALPAYLLGYGVEFKNEIYSRTSKRQTQKEFAEYQKKYFENILAMAANMNVDTIIIAGPGFTKEDIKKHGEESGITKKMGKTLIFESVSYAERSGIYELIRGEKVAKILDRERIRMEFSLMEEFLTNLSTGRSKYGVDNVSAAVENMEASMILVNDSVLGDQKIQQLLTKAEENGLRIEVFNSIDEVGTQLNGFKDIASVQN